MTTPDKSNRLAAFERPAGLNLIALSVAVLAAVYVFVTTLHGAVFLGIGDAEVFFRAGWAAWTGYPLYEVTDHHGWAYHYPPTFALLLGVFADPLPGYPRLAWSLPFNLAVPAWYALNVGAIAWTMRIWGAAVARHAGLAIEPGGTGAYWALRVLPPLMLVPYLADGLTSGQPTAILVLLVAASLAAEADGRPLLAAAPLAAAIAIKMFPAALLIIPLLRRDFRMTFWTIALTLVFLFAVPLVLVGYDATLHLYRDFWDERLSSFVRDTIDTRVQSQLSPWARDEVSFGTVVAKLFGTRPADSPSLLPAWSADVQVAFDFLVLAVLAAVGHRRFWQIAGPTRGAPWAVLVAGATLFAVIPAMLPVAQTHYFGQALPLVALALVETWRQAGRVRFGRGIASWTILAWGAFAWTDIGVPSPFDRIVPTTIVMIALAVRGLVLLRRQRTVAAPPDPLQQPALAALAETGPVGNGRGPA